MCIYIYIVHVVFHPTQLKQLLKNVRNNAIFPSLCHLSSISEVKSCSQASSGVAVKGRQGIERVFIGPKRVISEMLMDKRKTLKWRTLFANKQFRRSSGLNRYSLLAKYIYIYYIMYIYIYPLVI